ncbi:MAG: hypothetical protein LBU04_01410 [Christensenellaceae bacterium]|jgi:hypothetical protein|nr:hypothetical protein [Christensenellaceae bacterium]
MFDSVAIINFLVMTNPIILISGLIASVFFILHLYKIIQLLCQGGKHLGIIVRLFRSVIIAIVSAFATVAMFVGTAFSSYGIDFACRIEDYLYRNLTIAKIIILSKVCLVYILKAISIITSISRPVLSIEYKIRLYRTKFRYVLFTPFQKVSAVILQ